MLISKSSIDHLEWNMEFRPYSLAQGPVRSFSAVQPLGDPHMLWSFFIVTPYFTAVSSPVLLPIPPDCNRISAPVGRMLGGTVPHTSRSHFFTVRRPTLLPTPPYWNMLTAPFANRISGRAVPFGSPHHFSAVTRSICEGSAPLPTSPKFISENQPNRQISDTNEAPSKRLQTNQDMKTVLLSRIIQFLESFTGPYHVDIFVGGKPLHNVNSYTAQYLGDVLTNNNVWEIRVFPGLFGQMRITNLEMILQNLTQHCQRIPGRLYVLNAALGNHPFPCSDPITMLAECGYDCYSCFYIKDSGDDIVYSRGTEMVVKEAVRNADGSSRGTKDVPVITQKTVQLPAKENSNMSLSADGNKPQTKSTPREETCSTKPSSAKKRKVLLGYFNRLKEQLKKKQKRIKGSPYQKGLKTSTKSCKLIQKRQKASLNKSSKPNQSSMVKTSPAELNQSKLTVSSTSKRAKQSMTKNQVSQIRISTKSTKQNKSDKIVLTNSNEVNPKRMKAPPSKSHKLLLQSPTTSSARGKRKLKALAAASHKQDQTKKNSSSANSTSCQSEREVCCSVSLNLNRKRSQSLSDASGPVCIKRLRRHSAKSFKSNLTEKEIPTVQSPLAITVPSYKANQKNQTTVLSIPSESPTSIEERKEEEADSPKQESPTTIQPILKIKEEQDPFRVKEERPIIPSLKLEAEREDLWPTGTKQENPTSPFTQEPERKYLWPIKIKEERSRFPPMKQETDMEGMIPFRIKEERPTTPCLEPELEDAQPVRIHEERPTTPCIEPELEDPQPVRKNEERPSTPPCKEQTEMKGLLCIRIKEERSTTPADPQDDEEVFASTSDGQKKSDVPRDCTRSHQVSGINQNEVTTPVCAEDKREDESTYRQSCRLNLDENEEEVPEQSFYHSRTTTSSPSREADLHHDAKRLPYPTCSSQKETTLPPICNTWREVIERECLEEKNKLVQEVMLDMCYSHINEYASYLCQPDAHPDYVEEYKKFKDGERKYVSMCSYVGTSEFTEGWEKYWTNHIFNCFEKCWEERKLYCKSVLVSRKITPPPTSPLLCTSSSDFTSMEPPPKKMCKDKQRPMFQGGCALVSEPVPLVPALALLTYVKDRLGIREVPVNTLYDEAATLRRMGCDPTPLLQNEETAYILFLLKNELQYILTEKTILDDDSSLLSKAQSILQDLMSITNLQLNVNIALIAQFTMHKNMCETANFIHKIILEKRLTLSKNDEKAINKAVLDEKLNLLM